MRWRGVNHVELSVINYEESIKFYDRMFGWLGYASLWTLDVGHRSTYYLARPPVPQSFIGIQPATGDQPLPPAARAPGIHHIALWARSKREVDQFYQEFLLKERVVITDGPAEYPQYAPGYYAVFFLDPSGIRWELTYMPRVPRPWDLYKFMKTARALRKQHPEWKHPYPQEMLRRLPSRKDLASPPPPA
jgi:catechol 2,3-dioxygenase-like lactoylglutathione lyase family enzyme